MNELFKDNFFFCPICKKYNKQSEYLRTVIADEKTLWLANMITHYRHQHISSWNKCWGKNGSRYRSKWFTDYDYEKAAVNERAKRQIIRKCKSYLIENKIELKHFQMLPQNEDATLVLAKMELNKELLQFG